MEDQRRPRRMTADDYAEAGVAVRVPCSLGVGCDDYGVCYAMAAGQPAQCPFHEPKRCDECGDETGACSCD